MGGSSVHPGHHADEPASAPNLAATRILLFLALLLFLTLQADGFPFAPGPTYQLHLLPLTALFLLLLGSLLFPARLARALPARLLRIVHAPQTLIAALAVSVLLAAALLFAEARAFARVGYQSHPTALAGLTLLGIAALRTSLRSTPTRLIAVVLALLTAFSLFSLFSFPLRLGRSDMLPLLAAANQTLLAHQNPYRLYNFPNDPVLLTYLPGTLLAYLPATALHLDLRLTNLLALLLLAAALLTSTRPDRRYPATALIALFLLSPYLLFRHELYTPPHWLVLAAALLLAQRRHSHAAAILFGLGVAMSQFSWILLPFFLLFLYETRGLRLALHALALSLLAAALLITPFALWNPHALFFNVLSHWAANGVTARPINLSVLLAAHGYTSLLQPLQLALLTTLFVVALRTHACRTFTGALRIMSLALAAFILFNLLVWAYFFLLLELLLLLYLLSANALLREPAPVSSIGISPGNLSPTNLP